MSEHFFSDHHHEFIRRHIGSSKSEQKAMLDRLGIDRLDELMALIVPDAIHLKELMPLPSPRSEAETLSEFAQFAAQNQRNDCYIGMGFYPTYTPSVILRNVFENPGWYTAYTPYQPEIAQGRLEALTNFQQMIMDLTAMPMANASLLDEATAAAEAMAMSQRCVKRNKSINYFADQNCHPQTLAVLATRAEHFGFNLIIGDIEKALPDELFGALIQYPNTYGEINDINTIIATIHDKKALVTVATDLLALTLLNPPGEMGADIVVGNSQRFGVPMGFGGPHAAFFAFKAEFKRALPGRIIGVSKDTQGKMAFRMAMQTREQHIRREKATSNICTSQALLAVMASFYAIYHGPEGLKSIANRIYSLTYQLKQTLESFGIEVLTQCFFDTLTISVNNAKAVWQKAQDKQINLRLVDQYRLGISLSETTTLAQYQKLLNVLVGSVDIVDADVIFPEHLARKSSYLSHAVFHQYHSETNIMRYMKLLENKDLALNTAMIPLGSCTMKLNAATEMQALSWPEFADLHPFVPVNQCQGYLAMIDDLAKKLAIVTGYDEVSFQPNAGSQGEYAGLLAIKGYLASTGQSHRNICLIPESAHGTNPASAAMAGMQVVIVGCDDKGNVDKQDLQNKIAEYQSNLACLMVTYPSTHGVFEQGIDQVCQWVHDAGGQVYVDGANMNALVGVAAPGQFGADVSHLNLHKTFAIPHGGGGPGMGPIGVKSHLAPFLPKNPLSRKQETVVSSTEFGSASILTISWAYLNLLGAKGLTLSTQVAILQANYIASRLSGYYSILYKGESGFVAHECIIDIRPLKASSGISEEDIAKRLMDYGFHAPTMSFPVAGTLMVEPTESESKQELDRFCDAMISIYHEISKVEQGVWPLEDNPLVNAPHTHQRIITSHWTHPYSRELAAYPLPNQAEYKFWPSVSRVDNVYGDRNLFCACPDIKAYQND